MSLPTQIIAPNLQVGTKISGYGYIVTTTRGEQILLSATFSPSATQSKKYLKYMQHQRKLSGIPPLGVVARTRVTLCIDSIDSPRD